MSWWSPRILLLGGPGGVGKTTLAAALGVQFARRGSRTVVLTVDPAKRLAQALGFTAFASELQRVEVGGAEGGAIPGELHATMLDSRRYLDRVFSKFARSEEQRQRILANPLYRITVDTMGGTQEYAAMERLLEFAQDPAWDKIIVDTPPTQNAVDLLSAPQRLADFMDSSVLRWFQGQQPGYLGLFRRSTRLAMKFLEKVFGSEFLSTFGSFMDDLEGMHAGFRDRNLEVIRLLQSEATAFLLVTYPSEARYQESVAFAETLRSRGIPLRALLLNRVEPAPPPDPPGPTAPPDDARRTESIRDWYRALWSAQDYWVRRFRESLALPTREIPRQTGPLHDIAALSRLGGMLVE